VLWVGALFLPQAGGVYLTDSRRWASTHSKSRSNPAQVTGHGAAIRSAVDDLEVQCRL
jgi:hypothetical protein